MCIYTFCTPIARLCNWAGLLEASSTNRPAYGYLFTYCTSSTNLVFFPSLLLVRVSTALGLVGGRCLANRSDVLWSLIYVSNRRYIETHWKSRCGQRCGSFLKKCHIFRSLTLPSLGFGLAATAMVVFQVLVAKTYNSFRCIILLSYVFEPSQFQFIIQFLCRWRVRRPTCCGNPFNSTHGHVLGLKNVICTCNVKSPLLPSSMVFQLCRNS